KSFWDLHELLLEAPLPARNVEAVTPPERFRRVDSWNVPIPDFPDDSQTADPIEVLDRDRTHADRSRDLGAPKNTTGSHRDVYAASDRDSYEPGSYVPEKYRDPPSDLRHPDRDARELNGNRSQEDELRVVRHDPQTYDSQRWNEMPTRKAMNLMFGGKKTNARTSQQATSQENQGSPFFPSNWNMFWPFVFATLGLIASLAFNFHLGYIAWDIHGQYQDVVADMADMEAREDDKPHSLLENRSSNSYSARVDQPVSRRRSISI
ncbi:hypothetical protein ACFL2H_05895, partial [Planctomycetota bacterium]